MFKVKKAIMVKVNILHLLLLEIIFLHNVISNSYNVFRIYYTIIVLPLQDTLYNASLNVNLKVHTLLENTFHIRFISETTQRMLVQIISIIFLYDEIKLTY